MSGTPLDDNLENTFADLFRKMIAQSEAHLDTEITAENVFQPALKINRPFFAEICSKLMQPGSDIVGIEHLLQLAGLAKNGESCLICAQHVSNFDVPNLYTLMNRVGKNALDCFDRMIFIAGRKLNEDSKVVKMLTEMFNRVILSPKSYLDSLTPEEADKRKTAKKINIAAQRKLRQLRREGHIVLLYPTGTRTRSDIPETARALEETGAYLRMFDNLCFMNVSGNTLPPSLSNQLATEFPHYDVVKFIVGPVIKTETWLQSANAGFDQKGKPNSERKQYLADLVMEEINKL